MNSTITKNTIKKIAILVIETIVIFFISYFICKYVNREHTIKALHKDDVENFVFYLELPDIKDWIITKITDRFHYRPVFYIILFQIFKLITGNVEFIMVINFFISAIISTVIYMICRSFKISRILSFCVILLYTYSPFAYYNIYQAIGCVEAFPILFSILILALCIHSINAKVKVSHMYFIMMAVLYLLLIFTHERYFPTAVIMLIAVCTNKAISKKSKVIYVCLYMIEVVFFFLIRYYHLGIWVPRGTACTMLLEFLDGKRAVKFFAMQIAYIFGINFGEECFCAKNVFNTSPDMLIAIILQAIAMLVVFIMYIVKKIRNNKQNHSEKFIVEVFVFTYIFFCILQSSLTIRLELRWVYASFTVAVMYFVYMITYLLKSESKNSIKLNRIAVAFTTTFILLRLVESVYLRTFYDSLHIIYEQKLTNNLAEHTVYKYGIDKIKSANIYIISDNFKILTDTEYEHFFDTFDGVYSNKPSIILEIEKDELINAMEKGNYLMLVEYGDRSYKEFHTDLH